MQFDNKTKTANNQQPTTNNKTTSTKHQAPGTRRRHQSQLQQLASNAPHGCRNQCGNLAGLARWHDGMVTGQWVSISIITIFTLAPFFTFSSFYLFSFFVFFPLLTFLPFFHGYHFYRQNWPAGTNGAPKRCQISSPQTQTAAGSRPETRLSPFASIGTTPHPWAAGEARDGRRRRAGRAGQGWDGLVSTIFSHSPLFLCSQCSPGNAYHGCGNQ